MCGKCVGICLTYSRCLCLQVGLVKKYGDADAVPGMLNLVKLELGMSPEIEFKQVNFPILL